MASTRPYGSRPPQTATTEQPRDGRGSISYAAAEACVQQRTAKSREKPREQSREKAQSRTVYDRSSCLLLVSCLHSLG